MIKQLSRINLPFSFCRTTAAQTHHEKINLPGNISWLTANRLPYNQNFLDDLKICISDSNAGCVIDGCNEGTASFLSSKGFEKINLGKEAVLEMNGNHFDKKSLKELVRRGLRNKIFVELHFNSEISEKLFRFRKECSHGNEPQLKYLFNDEMNDFNRLFVISDEQNNWLGAIMISDKDKSFAQTELILRKKNAPVGIMEAMIYLIYKKLQTEGCKFWSLGAVP